MKNLKPKKINRSLELVSLGYCVYGAACGAALGLINLGLPGLMIGLAGGLLFSYFVGETLYS